MKKATFQFRERTEKILNAARNINPDLPDNSDSDVSAAKDSTYSSDTDYIPPSVSDESEMGITLGSDDDFDYIELQPLQLEPDTLETAHADSECNLGNYSKFSTPSNNTRKRKHNCLYCDLFVSNFSRHLERQHCDKVEVQKFLFLEKNNPERKRLINKIRKEGDFCSGEAIPVQKKKLRYEIEQCEDNTMYDKTNNKFCEFLPCIHCKGYYAHKTLRRHVKRCYLNKNAKSGNHTRPQVDGHTLMAQHFGPNDPLRTSGVLNSLKADDISMVAKRDKIICEVARKYVRPHKEKHLVLVAKRYMRRLARLLIETQNIEKNKNLSLLSILHPSKFQLIVQATRNISLYDSAKRAYSFPSLTLQMGTIIKKAIAAAYSLEIQKNLESPILHVLDCFKKLIEEEWATEVTTEAGQNLHLNRFNKPTLMPTAENIATMKNYLDALIEDSKIKLEENPKNEEAYKKLTEGTYCSVLLFNKRRVGELQRILLDAYLKIQNNPTSGEFEKLLSPTEKILIQKLSRIVIRGKRGRGVPVLFDKLTQGGIDLAIKHRNNFFETYNPYLFGVCHSESPISGYHVFRKHVNLALGNSNKTATLTSTKLRKHLATIAQILKMGPEDLEQLATFMGHTTRTHQEWYRLPSDIYQTAKVSKLLLLAQSNNIDKYKNCKLDEINVEDDIVEAQHCSSSENEEELEEWQIESNSKKQRAPSRITSKNKKKKIVEKKWTLEEKNITESYFKRHIKNKTAPKKEEVLNLMQLHPILFKDRTWVTIKTYVFNQYSKK